MRGASSARPSSHARGPASPDASPECLRTHRNPRRHHHRLFRVPARIHHTAVRNPRAGRQLLEDVQREALKAMGDELLWPNSMPCWLPENEKIFRSRTTATRISGDSKPFTDRAAHRYGRRMQTIAGIHYNWSLPEEAWIDLTGIEDGKAARDRGYFMPLRGFRRNYWLLLWLFGASPAMDRAFLARPNAAMPRAL